MSVIRAVKPAKLRKPAAIYRLIQRRVKGKMKSPYWQVRVRIGRGKYQQRSTGTTLRAAAKEYARLWIAQDFPQLCQALGITPLEKPSLDSPPPPLCHNTTPAHLGALHPSRLKI